MDHSTWTQRNTSTPYIKISYVNFHSIIKTTTKQLLLLSRSTIRQRLVFKSRTIGALCHQSYILQQGGLDLSANKLSRASELYLDEFTKTAGIIVATNSCVSEALQDWITLKDFGFN